jgi:hypothetical protein
MPLGQSVDLCITGRSTTFGLYYALQFVYALFVLVANGIPMDLCTVIYHSLAWAFMRRPNWQPQP